MESSTALSFLTISNIVFAIILIFAVILLVKTFQIIFKIISIFLIIFSFLGFYGTKIEPYQLKIYEHNIVLDKKLNKKYAVVGDLHLGHHKKSEWTLRIVNEINQANVDAVLFTGDWISQPITPTILTQVLSPLQYLKAPAYTVLGNHDNGFSKSVENLDKFGVVEKGGKFLKEILKNELQKNNVKVIENDFVNLNGVNLIGIGDNASNLNDLQILNKFSLQTLQESLILTHDPDLVYKYPQNLHALTISGHTHCGQVNLPILKEFAIPTKHQFQENFQIANDNKLFISCGAGETLLPIRLFNPPRIDILHL